MKKKKRCATCKFWVEDDRRCEGIEYNEFGFRSVQEESNSDEAFYSDYAGYNATLWTGPDFYCSNWEKK